MKCPPEADPPSEEKQGNVFLFAGVLFVYGPPLPIPNREVKVYEPDDISSFGDRESRVCQQSKTHFLLMILVPSGTEKVGYAGNQERIFIYGQN